MSVALLSLLSVFAPSPARAADDAAPPPPPRAGLGTSPTDEQKKPMETISLPTVTEVPPWLRGDVTLDYAYDRLGGHLSEHIPEERGDTASRDVDVGERALLNHVLDIGAVFSAGPGVAVTVDVPVYVRETTWFGTSQTMVYDPGTGSGTMNGTTAVDFGTVNTGTGVEGVWVGLAGTPFSEAFTSRGNRATWRIGGAIRTANAHNFYTAPDGKRGAGNGAMSFRLDNAFSTTLGTTQPYLSARYQSDGGTTVDVTDSDGNVVAAGMELRGARSADVRFGAEVLASHNYDAGTNVRMDLHGVVRYSSWSLVPSGIYLPSVLDVTTGVASQMSESMEAGGGLGFMFQPIPYMRISLHGEVAYHLPQRIESPYPIYTGNDTLHSIVGLDLGIRIR